GLRIEQHPPADGAHHDCDNDRKQRRRQPQVIGVAQGRANLVKIDATKGKIKEECADQHAQRHPQLFHAIARASSLAQVYPAPAPDRSGSLLPADRHPVSETCTPLSCSHPPIAAAAVPPPGSPCLLAVTRAETSMRPPRGECRAAFSIRLRSTCSSASGSAS